MFLHVFVILFTGGYPSMHCRWYPDMPCSRSPGGGWYPSMPCRFPGPHPRGKLRGLARVVSWPTPGGGACRGGCLLRGVCGEPPPRHRDSYCCRRYTSYWIAFLYNCESMISINADADARCEYALRDRINE